MKDILFNPADPKYGAHSTRTGAFNAAAIQACFEDFLDFIDRDLKYAKAKFVGPGGDIPIGVPAGQKAAISLAGGWPGWHLNMDWRDTVLRPDESCGGAAIWDALDLRGPQGSFPYIVSMHPGIQNDASLIPGALWLVGRAAHKRATGDHDLDPLIGKGFARFGLLNNAAEMFNAEASRVILYNDDGLPLCNDGANRHLADILAMSDSVMLDAEGNPLLTEGQGESFERVNMENSTFMKGRWDWENMRFAGIGSGPAAWVTRWSGHTYAGSYFVSRDHAPLVLKIDANRGRNLDLSQTHYEGSSHSTPPDPATDYGIPHCVRIESYPPHGEIDGLRFSTGNVHATSGEVFDISSLQALTLRNKDIGEASGAKIWSHPSRIVEESYDDPARSRVTIEKDHVHVIETAYGAAAIEIVAKNLNGSGGGWLKLMGAGAASRYHGGPNFKMTTGPLTASSGNPGEVLVSAAGAGQIHICNRLDKMDFGIELVAVAEPLA